MNIGHNLKATRQFKPLQASSNANIFGNPRGWDCSLIWLKSSLEPDVMSCTALNAQVDYGLGWYDRNERYGSLMGLFFFGRIFFLVDAKQMFARLVGSGTEGCRTCWAAETVPAWKEVPTDVSINRELDSTNFKESEV